MRLFGNDITSGLDNGHLVNKVTNIIRVPNQSHICVAVT